MRKPPIGLPLLVALSLLLAGCSQAGCAGTGGFGRPIGGTCGTRIAF